MDQLIDDLRDEIKSLKFELAALKTGMPATSQSDQQQEQQQQQRQQDELHDPLQLLEFTPPSPDKYADLRYIATDERQKIKFDMSSSTMRFLSGYGHPVRFCMFERIGEKGRVEATVFDGMTNTNVGAFLTPIPGKYRFHVIGRMNGGDYKAEWYLCCVRKEDFIYSKFQWVTGDDRDTKDVDSEDFDSDDDDPDSDKEQWKRKERIFIEKTRRHFLFTLGSEESTKSEAFVGVDCEKGLVFWVDVIPLKGTTRADACRFSGRLVC